MDLASEEKMKVPYVSQNIAYFFLLKPTYYYQSLKSHKRSNFNVSHKYIHMCECVRAHAQDDVPYNKSFVINSTSSLW